MRVNVHGHGGGGVCEHGGCPPLPTVGGTGRWAPRGGCEDRGILPSGQKQEKKNTRTHTFISHFFMTDFLLDAGLSAYLIVSWMLGAGIKTLTRSRTGIPWPTGLQSE